MVVVWEVMGVEKVGMMVEVETGEYLVVTEVEVSLQLCEFSS